MATGTAKQRFQFEREYNLLGRLRSIKGLLARISTEKPPLMESESEYLEELEEYLHILIDNFELNTKILKEAKFGKSTQ